MSSSWFGSSSLFALFGGTPTLNDVSRFMKDKGMTVVYHLGGPDEDVFTLDEVVEIMLGRKEIDG